MIGVASLSLAACGGGESTVSTQQPKTEPVKRLALDCTAVPLPEGCPDPESTTPAVPLPLAGLTALQKAGAAMAIQRPLEGKPFLYAERLKAVVSANNGDANKDILHYTARVNYDEDKFMVFLPNPYSGRFRGTKIPEIVPTESSGGVSYAFDMFNPSLDARKHSAFSTQLDEVVIPLRVKVFSLKDNEAYASVKRVESIATQLGEGWDYSILQASVPSVKGGEKDSTLYAELWTDLPSSSVSATDYMVGGWWLMVPDKANGDYRFGAVANGAKGFLREVRASVGLPGLTGSATYKGHATGLHTSSENGMASIQRLLGKVTLTANFQDTASRGWLEGKIHDLTLDNQTVEGEILLIRNTTNGGRLSTIISDGDYARAAAHKKYDIGNIEGVNYKGRWAASFTGDRASDNSNHPTGIVGVVGGSGGGNSFVASFGAKKVEAE